jgi:hypothetical protein
MIRYESLWYNNMIWCDVILYTFIDICNTYSTCPYIHSFICFECSTSTCIFDYGVTPVILARSCDPTWSWGRWLGPLGTHCGPWMMKGNYHQMVRRPYFRWIGRFHQDILVLANKNRDIKSTMWLCNGIGYTRIIQRLNWLMGIFFLPKFAEMMFILPGNQGRGLGIIILLLLSFVP